MNVAHVALRFFKRWRFVAEDAGANMTAIGLARADTNGDGERTGDDVLVILRRIAHLD